MINNNFKLNSSMYFNKNICFGNNTRKSSDSTYENSIGKGFIVATCTFSAFHVAKLGYLKLIKKAVLEENELARHIAFSALGPLFLVADKAVEGVKNLFRGQNINK